MPTDGVVNRVFFVAHRPFTSCSFRAASGCRGNVVTITRLIFIEFSNQKTKLTAFSSAVCTVAYGVLHSVIIAFSCYSDSIILIGSERKTMNTPMIWKPAEDPTVGGPQIRGILGLDAQHGFRADVRESSSPRPCPVPLSWNSRENSGHQKQYTRRCVRTVRSVRRVPYRVSALGNQYHGDKNSGQAGAL